MFTSILPAAPDHTAADLPFEAGRTWRTRVQMVSLTQEREITPGRSGASRSRTTVLNRITPGIFCFSQRSFDQPQHHSSVNSVERVHQIVSVEHSEQALYSPCCTMWTRFDVFSEDTPRVLNGSQYNFLVGIIHRATSGIFVKMRWLVVASAAAVENKTHQSQADQHGGESAQG
ncbi:hypothetical protein [Bradyrhizobium sp. URHD0069]|uniref:hypothetical protein n=1 Tax=Bradyrhizobium sp. URHD0069 TaxID=1380355 RepID=UPI0012DBD067|nr:hypothetical protein [Bradyrhizobium sp. URHD0069]